MFKSSCSSDRQAADLKSKHQRSGDTGRSDCRLWRGLAIANRFVLLSLVTGPPCLVTNPAKGQMPSDSPSIAVVREAFESIQARQWAALAAIVDPSSKAEFRTSWLSFAKKLATAQGLSPDDTLAGVMTKDRTFAELAQMPSDVLLADYLEATDGRPQFTIQRRIIGEVLQNDTLSHIVYEKTVSSKEVMLRSLEVISARYSVGSWMIVLNRDVGGEGTVIAWTSPPPPAGN